MEKTIGILAWDVSPKETMGVTTPYLQWASQFGKVRMVMFDEFRKDIDVLILPGGIDVDSARYSKAPDFSNSRPNQFLEWFDKEVLPYYINEEFKIFGVCRGMQTLNVALGGSLNQDINHPYSSSNSDLKAHKLYEAVDNRKPNHAKSVEEVGSWHHQSIKILGSSMTVTHVADDNTAEVIKHKHLPFVGVQYHPERCYDSLSYNLMLNLLKR